MPVLDSRLADSPREVDGLFADSRPEMNSRFAEFKQDIDAKFADFRREVDTGFTELRATMNVGFAQMDTKSGRLNCDLIFCPNWRKRSLQRFPRTRRTRQTVAGTGLSRRRRPCRGHAPKGGACHRIHGKRMTAPKTPFPAIH